MATKSIPTGFRTVTPFLTVKNAADLMQFLKKAFNAEEINSAKKPNGDIANAEIKIGDTRIMLAETTERYPEQTSVLYMYVNDIDKTYKQAISAGATSIIEPADQFYGDRNAEVKDPAGNTWWIATHIEDVTPEKLKKRMAEQHN